MKWQPIHTAPKDQWVLCWVMQRDPKPGDEDCPENPGELPGACAVMVFDQGEWQFVWSEDQGSDEYGPTHWMPLPQAPRRQIGE
jgi:hypothetical protein